MKRRAWIAGAALLGGAVGGGLQAWRSSAAPADPGDPWSSTLADLDGRPLPLAAYRGRPLLLNFWASWCAPCVAELPDLAAFMADAARREWRWLAVAVDRPEAVRRFLDAQRLRLPLALAESEGLALSRRLGNTAATLPFSALFDRSGALRETRKGPLDDARLSAWARALE